MESKLANLHVDFPPGPETKPPTRQDEVIESWEDDNASSPVDGGSNLQTPTDSSDYSLKPIRSIDPALNPPPPTPISPGNDENYIDWSPARVLGGGRPKPYSPVSPSTPLSDSDRERRRPEKTTATANRLIAAGLGMKAPKKTEDQKQYDRAVREQEIKRRNKEKEERDREREADEKAKAAIWDDS